MGVGLRRKEKTTKTGVEEVSLEVSFESGEGARRSGESRMENGDRMAESLDADNGPVDMVQVRIFSSERSSWNPSIVGGRRGRVRQDSGGI